MMAAMRDVVNARRRVPRQEIIGLNVAVVREDVAERIKIEVVRIAEAVRDDFAIAPVGSDSQERSGFGAPNRRPSQARMFVRYGGFISDNDIEPAVRPFPDGMPAMFEKLHREQALGWAIGHTVAVSIVISKQPAISNEVKRWPVKAHAHPA